MHAPPPAHGAAAARRLRPGTTDPAGRAATAAATISAMAARAARMSWWATTAVVTSTGAAVALFLPVSSLVALGLCALGLSWVGCRYVTRDRRAAPPDPTGRSTGEGARAGVRPGPSAKSVSGVAALFVAAVGVMTLTGASGLELLTILALTSPPAVTLSRRHLPALFPVPVHRPAPVEPRGGVQDRQHLRSPFQALRPQDGAKPEPVEASPVPPLALKSPESMSTDQLCLAWRRSFSVLHRAVTLDELVVVIAARAGYLDELERRHEAGFSAWMANGPRPGSDPARYLPGPPHDPRPSTTTTTTTTTPHQPAPGTDVPDPPRDDSGVGRPDPQEG